MYRTNDLDKRYIEDSKLPGLTWKFQHIDVHLESINKIPTFPPPNLQNILRTNLHWIPQCYILIFCAFAFQNLQGTSLHFKGASSQYFEGNKQRILKFFEELPYVLANIEAYRRNILRILNLSQCWDYCVQVIIGFGGGVSKCKL